LMDHLDHRSQAVGGTRSSGNNAVLGGIEQMLVDAHDHVQRAFFLDWSARHHTLHTLIQVSLKYGNGFHLAAGINYQIAALPIDVCNRSIGCDLDALATAHDRITRRVGFATPSAMHRIEVDQVCVSRCVPRWVINLHELELWPAPRRTQGKATDT